MSRHRRIELREKLLRDTEHFLNLSLGYDSDSNSAQVSSRRLAENIEAFFRKVSRLVKLKSLHGAPNRRRSVN